MKGETYITLQFSSPEFDVLEGTDSATAHSAQLSYSVAYGHTTWAVLDRVPLSQARGPGENISARRPASWLACILDPSFEQDQTCVEVFVIVLSSSPSSQDLQRY